jgi:hypothetical protein
MTILTRLFLTIDIRISLKAFFRNLASVFNKRASFQEAQAATERIPDWLRCIQLQ